jgi:hypothetical protein
METLSYAAGGGTITFDVDPARRRVRLTARGPVDGPGLRAAHVDLLAKWPDAAAWDMLINRLEDTGTIAAADVPAIADLYRQKDPTAPPAQVAFVTTDPNFKLWAKAMDFQFGGSRVHSVHASIEAAERFLDEAAERTSR